MDVWMKGRRPEILALRPAATQVTRDTSWAMFMMTMTVFVLVVVVVVMMFE